MRRDFINFVKRSLQQILNYLGLLVDSAKVICEDVSFLFEKHCNGWSDVRLYLHTELASDNRCSVCSKQSNGRLTFVFLFSF